MGQGWCKTRENQTPRSGKSAREGLSQKNGRPETNSGAGGDREELFVDSGEGVSEKLSPIKEGKRTG